MSVQWALTQPASIYCIEGFSTEPRHKRALTSDVWRRHSARSGDSSGEVGARASPNIGASRPPITNCHTTTTTVTHKSSRFTCCPCGIEACPREERRLPLLLDTALLWSNLAILISSRCLANQICARRLNPYWTLFS